MKTRENNNIVVSASADTETRSALTERQLRAVCNRRVNLISDLAEKCYNVRSINGNGAPAELLILCPRPWLDMEKRNIHGFGHITNRK